MSIEHKNISDPNIHEPKDVAAATSGTVYVADGSGSGSWTKVTSSGVTPEVVYAQGYIEGSATATTISTVDTPVAVDFGGNFNSDTTSNFTVSVNGEFTYTGTEDATVLVAAGLFVDQASASSVEYTFKVTLNDTPITASVSKVETSGSEGRSVSVNSLVTVSTNDVIEIWVENNTDTTDITVENATISVIKTGF